MATNNPYPWVMPSVAAANGFGTGGGTQAANFDPTNPGRRKRRPGVSGDDGGIGGVINAGASPTLKSPASMAAANDDKSLAALGDRLKSAYGFDFSAPANNGSAAPAAAPVSPLQLAQSARATASPLLRRGEFFPTTIDRTPPVSADAGRIPATPPAVTPASGIPAGQIPVAPVLKPASAVSGVDTGVTLPDGRKLPYGAMVNGVPTFSDGSGGFDGHQASIPRTMTDADIKGLGARLPTIPSGTLTPPVAGTPTEPGRIPATPPAVQLATGTTATPNPTITTATAPFLQAPSAFNSDNTEANVAAILRSRQGGKFGITPEMNAASDLAAVTNQDPRSTLGLAAMNAGRRAAAAPTVLQRKSALDDLAGLTAAVRANALATTQGQNALATANAEGQNVLQRANLGGLYDIAGQRLRNEGQLANTDLTGQYGIASLLASPKKTGEMTDRDYLTQLNAGVQGQIKSYNEQQAMLPAEKRQALSDEMIAEMRALQARALGLRTATNPRTGERMMNVNGSWRPM